MSQAEIEARFFDRAERIRRGELQPEEAFGDEGDWLLEIGERRFLLHPGTVRWLVYDRLHDEWYDTGYGPGQAMLVAEGKRTGAVPIPEAPRQGEPATVAGWCLVTDGAQPLGAVRTDEVRRAQAEGWLPAAARVWDGASDRWQSAEAFAGPACAPPPGGLPPKWVSGEAGKEAGSGSGRELGTEVLDPAAAGVTPVVQAPVAPVVQTPASPTMVDVPPVSALRPVFCGYCGAKLGPQARFCGSCGHPTG